jgi:hypothetical protein
MCSWDGSEHGISTRSTYIQLQVLATFHKTLVKGGGALVGKAAKTPVEQGWELSFGHTLEKREEDKEASTGVLEEEFMTRLVTNRKLDQLAKCQQASLREQFSC